MRKPKTKIVATVSGLKSEVSFLKELYDAGASTFRLNTAHQTLEEASDLIDRIREVSKRIAILIDTKGPEIRTTGIESSIEFEENEEIFIIPEGEEHSGKSFSVSYDRFFDEVGRGKEILIDDGEVSFTVIERKNGVLKLIANNPGQVKNKKSVNVPDIHIPLPALTEKDEKFIAFAAEKKVDFIAHSFVRDKEDVLAVQRILDKYDYPVQIIAKIENREGIDNIEEILDNTMGVMIARGDLGIELPAADVPVEQKKIIRKCIKRGKIVITATQMLHSMINNPRPTRAEVSDVANAVMDGTDAIMLSGETAYGEYPIEAVNMMASIAKKIESEQKETKQKRKLIKINPIRFQLIKSAVDTARTLKARSIIVQTDSGRSARLISAYRGKTPILALSPNESTYRQLALSFGVEAYEQDEKDTLDERVRESVHVLLKEDAIKRTDLVVMLGSSPKNSYVTNFLEVGEANIFIGGRE